MRSKVCFFIKTLDNSGGTERVTTVLANELIKLDYEVHIVTWYGGNKSFYPLDSNVIQHHIFETDTDKIYNDYLKSLKIYRKILRQILPDYLIDVCVPLSLLSIPATIGTKIKIISWEHFNTGVTWNRYTGRISRYLVARVAHRVITLTTTDEKNYREKYGAKKITCISNPIVIEAEQKYNPESKSILAIGRFTHQKGFDLLLEIWSKVSPKVPGWKLNIVGGGPLKEELIALKERLNLNDTVHFLSPTNKVAEHYYAASIFLMTSRFEGLPLVLIEAKAFGLPIISFDCETGPRDIIKNKKDGVLVPYPDLENFAEELLSLINNAEQRVYYSKNTQLDLERFGMEHFVTLWKGILQ